jgi:hypothetical protein
MTKIKMGKQVLICTDCYKNSNFFCVENIQRLKYVQNHCMKYKVGKIQDSRVAKLKRVGHV